MNVESTSSNITTKKTDNLTPSSSATNPSQDTKTSFKDELNSAKTQEPNLTEQKNIEDPQVEQNLQNSQNLKTSEESKSKSTQTTQTAQITKNIEESSVQQVEDEKIKNIQSSQALQNAQNVKSGEESNIKQAKNEKNKNEQEKITNGKEDELFIKSYNELNSKIAAINDLKGNSHSKSEGTSSKTDDLKADSSLYCSTIKMDNNDISFYLNLVNNQQLSAQCGQLNNTGQINTDFTEIKSEATQKTVQVSATLLDALNESAKTNKPVRIDFDSDIAVIMKVDKNGVLSANFIPGSAAVEQYLRNNIESLRQNFDNQNLPYNELNYSNREKQNQEEKQSKNRNKENSDE